MKSKTKTGLVWLLALSLFISTSASAIALGSRIQYYTAIADVNSMIPLVPEYVTQEEIEHSAAAKMEKRLSALNVTYCAPNPDTYFTVSDDNTVWDSNTRVEIFKTEYENGEGHITVASNNGDKIIAPGTENSYSFMLKNNYGLFMDYTVTVKAYCTPDNVEIPVLCRLSRYDGKWVAGDENTWLSVEEFNGASDSAQMTTRSYVTYTLDWQWPFEGNDALDTALGQLAVDEDITLTIEIITTAEADLGGGGGSVTPDVPNPDNPNPDNPNPDNPNPDDPDPDQPPEEEPPSGDIVEPEPENPPSSDGGENPKPGTPLPGEIVEPLPGDPMPGVGQDLPPKTGDENHPALWMAMACVSFVLLLVLLLGKDKDEESEKAEGHKA